LPRPSIVRLGCLLTALCAGAGANPLHAQSLSNDGALHHESSEIAAGAGYDPMGYFLNQQARKGSPFFALKHAGTVWHFASPLHRSTFLTDPEKFTPRFRGYCAAAMARGTAIHADPTVWKVHSGRLYLFADRAALVTWSGDIKTNLAEAVGNWPAVLAKQ
jgi:hypothetical protein